MTIPCVGVSCGNHRGLATGAASLPAPRRRLPARGFTLLEVLVALAILGVAVVALIELASKSLRLVKTSGDYQQAVEIADRIATQTDPTDEGSDTGQEGAYQWERVVTQVEVPEELQPKQIVPGKEGAKLFQVKIAVRWGEGQSLELATMRTPTSPPQVTGTPVPATTTGAQQALTPNTGTPRATGQSQQGGGMFGPGGRSGGQFSGRQTPQAGGMFGPGGRGAR